MTNKRGISQIVTTVLILALVIIAIVVIWAFIRPIFTRTGEQITTETECLRLDLEVTNCEISNSNVLVTVKRNAGFGDLRGIRIVLSDGSINDNEPLEELESKIYTIESSNGITSANVAALVGEEKRACDPQHSPKSCT